MPRNHYPPAALRTIYPDAIRRETAEETGYHLGPVTKLFEAYMSPGSVTEKLHFFLAGYDASSKKAEGGGDANHGEEIEVVELELDEALKMIGTGEIQDAKAIMLLQYAKLIIVGSIAQPIRS